MRPCKLTMTAFASFRTTQEVDFAAFEGATLLLIHGVTGAGKSSILDAICFALYGSPADPERKSVDLRCNRAPLELLTRVELEFVLGPRRYRVMREPEQDRSKKKGSGTTRHASDATIWELDATGQPTLLITGASKVSDYVTALLGFEVEQFRQVIVLPQGRFRELLISRSEDREKILRSLFHTHVYSTFAELLRSKRNEAQQAFRTQRSELAGMLAGHAVESVAALELELGALQDQLQALDATLVGLLREHDAAKSVLEAATRHNLRIEQRAQLRVQLAALQADRAEIDAVRSRLDLLTRVAATVTSRRLWQEAASKQTLAQLDLRAREEERRVERQAHEAARLELARLLSQARVDEELDQQIQRLHEAQRLAAARDDAGRAIAKIRGAQERVTVRRAEILAQIDERAQAVERARKAADKIQLLDQAQALRVASRAEIEAHLAHLDALDQGLAQRIGFEVTKRAERAKLATLQAHADAIQRDHEVLVERYHASRAVSLAGELRRGEPCPVCGSTEHPTPARAQADEVDGTEVKASSERLASQRRSLEQQGSVLEVATQAASQAAGRVDALRIAARAAFEAAAGVRTEEVDDDDGLTRAAAERELVQRATQQLRTQLGQLEKEHSDLKTQIAQERAAADRLPELERALEALRTGIPIATAAQNAVLDRQDPRTSPATLDGASALPGLDTSDLTDLASIDARFKMLAAVAADRELALEAQQAGLDDELRRLVDEGAAALATRRAQLLAERDRRKAAHTKASEGAQVAEQRLLIAESKAVGAREHLERCARDLHAQRIAYLRDVVAQGLVELNALDPDDRLTLERGASRPLGGDGQTADLDRIRALAHDAQEATPGPELPLHPDYLPSLRTLEDPALLASLRARVKLFEDQQLAASSKLETFADLEPAAALHDDAALRSAVEASGLVLAEQQGAKTKLEGRRSSLEELKKRLDERGEQLATQEAALTTLSSVADAALGDTASRISFERYVLAALLDEVVESASLRLLEMTMQRLELVRVDEGARSNSPKGLDIHVLDAHVGRARPPHTLSGGESFLAALALSLALTDVVLRYSGGRRMDALFIDEGFGTLDPESLDKALDVLVKLPELGAGQATRCVVIISHVQELQARIAARMEVRRDAQGSEIRLHGTNPTRPSLDA